MTKPIKHCTAGAFILTDTQPRKVLLVHHKKTGKWLQPGGHQEPAENCLEAAIREVREETGLDITAYLDQPTVLDDIASSLPRPNYLLEEKISAYGGEPEHYHLDQLYVVTVPEQAVSHRLDESHGIGWFSLDQLAGLPMLENTLTILKQELTK